MVKKRIIMSCSIVKRHKKGENQRNRLQRKLKSVQYQSCSYEDFIEVFRKGMFYVALSFGWCFFHFSVLFSRCFPLIVKVFPSVLVCIPVYFSVNRFMTFEQRYSTVAFIYVMLKKQLEGQRFVTLHVF